jgi:hypothetical protein
VLSSEPDLKSLDQFSHVRSRTLPKASVYLPQVLVGYLESESSIVSPGYIKPPSLEEASILLYHTRGLLFVQKRIRAGDMLFLSTKTVNHQQMWGFVRLLETMIDNSHVGTPKR